MTRLVVFFASFVFLFVLGVTDADARRFGGGGSKGTFSRQMTAPKAAPRQVPNEASKQVAGKSMTGAGRGFGGMLMGLAAGGLLAALFMGGAFDGIQMFDIILIGAILAGAMYFLHRRRLQQAPQAFAGGYGASTNETPQHEQASNPPPAPFVSEIPIDAEEEQIIYGAPTWFDEKSFLKGAREHFLSLQKAWDANDLSTIEEYVTPQLYSFLLEERASQVNHVETHVHKLAVEMTSIQQLPNKTVELAIMFHGVVNEGRPEDSRFCEIWHLIRDMNQENAPWLIQGIEQVEG